MNGFKLVDALSRAWYTDRWNQIKVSLFYRGVLGKAHTFFFSFSFFFAFHS
jgi:hypothetical protein